MPKSDVQVHATVELELSPDGSEAHVLISRSEGGEAWTVTRILSLLSSRNITGIVTRDEIERKLKLFENGKEPSLNMTVAKGTPPTDPSPERPEWTDHAVPEQMTDIARDFVASEPPPEITTEVVEKIRRKKRVLKKSHIPFLPPKEEIVEVVERQVHNERVYLDPTVEGYGWVDAEQKVADLFPGDPGTPGKDVFGKAVPPAAILDADYHTGRNLNRKRNELFSETSGFLRYGTNWADIIPFRLHRWDLYLSDDRATCFLNLEPGSLEAPRPTPDEIFDAAEKLSYSREVLLDPQEIIGLIDNTIIHGNPVRGISLSRSRDGRAEVTVSEDRLTAVLSVRKSRGNGKPLKLRDIGAAITAARLKSFDRTRVQNDVTAFYRGPDDELTGYILAEGKAPTKGRDSVVEIAGRFYDPKKTEELKTRISASGRNGAISGSLAADFPPDLIETMAPVQPEQRVFSYSQPLTGEPGIDLYGQAIPGISGDEPRFRLFENVTQKQNVIISEVEGVLDVGKAEDGTYLLRVRQDSDAQVEVLLTPDRMLATLSVTGRSGIGRTANEEMIRTALSEAGVRVGIDEPALKEAIMQAVTGEEVVDAVVARGEMPIRPGQRALRYLVPVANNAGVRIREDGRADYKNQDRITQVSAGTDIAEIIPPQAEPRDGFDVTGKVIPVGESANFDAEVGANVAQTLRPDGTIVFVAKANGELVIDRNIISVRAVHLIRGDVGLKTGNIRFHGPVSVTGNVRSGFFVMSDGEIRVGEGVEAGLLSSGENILIRQGIRGGGKAVLRTKKNILAAFCEQATLLSVGDIVIDRSCMQSRVKCNGRLILTGEKGNLVGGQIQARNGVEAMNIGSDRSAHTQISFGQNYLISDHIEAESKEIEKLKARLVQVDGYLKTAETQAHRTDGLGPDAGTGKPLSALYQEKTKLLRSIEKRNMRIFMFREKFEEHFDSAVRVRGTVFPGTILESHGRTLAVSTAKKNVQFVFDTTTGRIEERPLNNS
jgi:hypothetical protein